MEYPSTHKKKTACSNDTELFLKYKFVNMNCINERYEEDSKKKRKNEVIKRNIILCVDKN